MSVLQLLLTKAWIGNMVIMLYLWYDVSNIETREKDGTR